MRFQANSKEDVLKLSEFMRNYPDKPKLVESLVHLGLMRFRENFLNDLMGLVAKQEDPRSINLEAFKLVSEIDETILSHFIEDAIDHAVNGSDKIDDDSVGGWSQSEIDSLLDDLQ